MNKLLRAFLLSFILLGLISLPLLSQSRENGAIQGRVTDETGEFLPGATVKLTSPNMIGGERTIITQSSGQFRFVALLPGIYALEISLEGFDTQNVPDIRVSAGKTLTLDLQLKTTTLEEEVSVIARSPIIDVKDSQQATTLLENELLVNIPITRSYYNIVNLAPGVTENDRLFGGAGGDLGTAYNMDGVNTSDPYFAGPWVLLDWNTIDEAKISGIGANAEYDGFTGGVVNVVTKSGGNSTTGGIELYYGHRNWHSNNAAGIDWEWGPDFSHLDRIDPTFFIGGPLKKDKLWYFANLSYQTWREDVVDFPEDEFEWAPRIFGKLTAQLGSNDRLQTTLAWEAHHINYRYAQPGWPVETSATYRSDDKYVNIGWLHTFSDRTFMETKFGGWHAIQRDIGNGGDAYPRIDDLTGEITENSLFSYDGYRWRMQANTSITHHAEDFIAGSHDFKFGAEFEHAIIREDYEWYTNGRYYIDYYGPYLLYEFEGYFLHGNIDRVSVYAQDSWSVSDRITFNPGLRYNIFRMGLDGENVYKANALAPRIGITFDLFGDNTTALKAHYGRYYDQLRITDVYPAMDIPDFYGYFWDEGEWVLDFVDQLGSARVDPDIKHPGSDQYSFSIERELTTDLSIELAYIYKKFINILGSVEILGQWEQVTYFDPYIGQTYNLWSLTTDPYDTEMLITNPKGGSYDTVPFTPETKYRSFQFHLTKRFSDRWQVMVTYAYSKADGNFDIGGGDREILFNDFFKSKNLTVNSEGHNLSDTTHVFKIHGSALLPLDIAFGVNFMYRSGYRYNNYIRPTWDDLEDYRRQDIRAESRGSSTYPDVYRLDLRLEKQFPIGKSRISGLLDIYNVFNSNTVLSTRNQVYYSSYGKVRDIMVPRRFQVGIRFHF
jgi:outer membrane receptor protein involved in Fe transport